MAVTHDEGVSKAWPYGFFGVFKVDLSQGVSPRFAPGVGKLGLAIARAVTPRVTQSMQKALGSPHDHELPCPASKETPKQQIEAIRGVSKIAVLHAKRATEEVDLDSVSLNIDLGTSGSPVDLAQPEVMVARDVVNVHALSNKARDALKEGTMLVSEDLLVPYKDVKDIARKCDMISRCRNALKPLQDELIEGLFGSEQVQV
jgi:hypothetical protein